MELDNTYLSRGEVNGSEKWKKGKNTAISGGQLAAIERCTFKLVLCGSQSVWGWNNALLTGEGNETSR